MVKNEVTQWNTYCNKSVLIDVNSDGLMDTLCSNVVQDTKMGNHFLINKGNMQFDFVKPEDVTEWVTWVEDAIVVEKETKGPDGEDILKDLEILIQ